jgi:hypothetical protein
MERCDLIVKKLTNTHSAIYIIHQQPNLLNLILTSLAYQKIPNQHNSLVGDFSDIHISSLNILIRFFNLRISIKNIYIYIRG